MVIQFGIKVSGMTFESKPVYLPMAATDKEKQNLIDVKLEKIKEGLNPEVIETLEYWELA